jgi:hypothetical protein
MIDRISRRPEQVLHQVSATEGCAYIFSVLFCCVRSRLLFPILCLRPRLHDSLHSILLGLSKWDVKVSPSASPVPPIFTASFSTSNFVLHFHAVFHLPASNFSELCLFSFALHLVFLHFPIHLCSLHLFFLHVSLTACIT